MPDVAAYFVLYFVETAGKVYLLRRQLPEAMIEHMPHFNLDFFSLESDPYFAPFLDYLKENDELKCSILTAVQFENLEIRNLIKRMSSDGLVEMSSHERDLESFSLCLTEKGRNLAGELANSSGLMTNLIPGLY